MYLSYNIQILVDILGIVINYIWILIYSLSNSIVNCIHHLKSTAVTSLLHSLQSPQLSPYRGVVMLSGLCRWLGLGQAPGRGGHWRPGSGWSGPVQLTLRYFRYCTESRWTWPTWRRPWSAPARSATSATTATWSRAGGWRTSCRAWRGRSSAGAGPTPTPSR